MNALSMGAALLSLVTGISALACMAGYDVTADKSELLWAKRLGAAAIVFLAASVLML
jgi:hypothetical protein